MRRVALRWVVLAVVFVLVINSGCCKRDDSDDQNAEQTAQVETAENVTAADKEPAEIKRFAVDSPFEDSYDSPVPKEPKRMWAKSVLFEKAPEFVVEKWLSGEPDTAGKYVLVEFWATWCPPCRKTIPDLNEFHKKFGDKLVVIGVSDEDAETVAKFADGKIEYFMAIDKQARMKKALEVKGIPHAIVIEPGGSVVWEGYPLLGGYELTEEVIDTILSAKTAKADVRKNLRSCEP